MTVIGLLHPGNMGAAVGVQLLRAGHEVRWLPAGRGARTRARAAAAGLVAVHDLRDCPIIMSICPPEVAVAVAEQIADGFRGTFVDLNAIAPGTAQRIKRTVETAGARYVDGSIIGLPPGPAGTEERATRIYLSGPRADSIVALFDGSTIDAHALPGDDQAASALKMAYAGWTKISAALLIACRQVAEQLGVEDALVAEWTHSQPQLAARWQKSMTSASDKGWRWTGEMREIADTFAAVDRPSGFGTAAAEIFAQFQRVENGE